MEKILKYLPLATLTVVLGMGISVANYLIDKTKEDTKNESKRFDTVEQKVETVKHVEQYRNNYDVMKLYQKMDSVATTQSKRDVWRDSMIMKMAVTQYQTKRYADSVNTYWKEYNASVEN